LLQRLNATAGSTFGASIGTSIGAFLPPPQASRGQRGCAPTDSRGTKVSIKALFRRPQ
jgi:hypothetical protein